MAESSLENRKISGASVDGGDFDDHSVLHDKDVCTLANLCGPRYDWKIILPFIGIAFALISVGYFLDIVTFTYITLTGDSEVRLYSMWSIGKDLPISSQNPSGFGIIWLQVIYIFLSLLLPLWGLLVISILFYYPLSKDKMKKLLFYTEINFAWSMLGPLILSVIVSSKQLPVFANDIVQNECKDCLTVVGGVNPTITVVVVGSLIQAILTIYLFSGARDALDIV